MKAPYRKISLNLSMEMRNLHQKQGLKGVDVVARYKSYCPRSVYRHMKMKITDNTGDKREFNGAKKLEILYLCIHKAINQHQTFLSNGHKTHTIFFIHFLLLF